MTVMVKKWMILEKCTNVRSINKPINSHIVNDFCSDTSFLFIEKLIVVNMSNPQHAEDLLHDLGVDDAIIKAIKPASALTKEFVLDPDGKIKLKHLELQHKRVQNEMDEVKENLNQKLERIYVAERNIKELREENVDMKRTIKTLTRDQITRERYLYRTKDDLECLDFVLYKNVYFYTCFYNFRVVYFSFVIFRIAENMEF